MARMGKKLRKAYEAIAVGKLYSLDEGIKLVKANAPAKFDETFEIACNLNIDVRKVEQNIRGMVQLPHGTGKKVRVCVFAKGPKVDEAKNAGADFVGGDELIPQIESGQIAFERCIATPDMMGVVGRLGKYLGPRGLMPNPKLGTVTMDVAAAVAAAKGGQIEYRSEKTGIVHGGVGKVSFSEQALMENVKAFMDAIIKARPVGIKGAYVKSIALSSTMGPGIKIDPASLS